MADSIVKLRVESSEYDAKLKRATQGLLHMEESCRKVGGTLAVLEKEDKQFVQSLGKMETVSKDARGRINELTKAFTELSVQYNRLSDEEKKGDFGKALRESLDQIAQRTRDAKSELNSIQSEISTDGNLLDQLSNKFGINIKQLGVWGAALGAGKLAMDVLKDAFFQSESNIDEWGRTVKGAEGAYDVFLQSLNNGNWSSFFSNLNDAINGARELYDALDRLGSIKSNNQAAIAILQQQIQQLRLQKQQGQNVDAQLNAATDRLAKLQKQAVDAGKTAGETGIRTTLRNSVNTTLGRGNNINDKTLNLVVNRILKGGQETMDAYARSYERLRKKGTTSDRVEKYRSSTGQVYERTVKGGFNINLLTKEQQKQYAIAKAVTERETQIQKGITTYANAVQEGAANAKEQFRNAKYGQSGRGSTTTTTNTTEPKTDAKFQLTEVKGIRIADFIHGENITELQNKLRNIMQQINNTDDPALRLDLQLEASDLKTQIEQLTKDPLDFKINLPKQERKQTKKERDTMQDINKGVGGVSSIASGLKGLGIELGDGFDKVLGVVDSIMSIVGGVIAVNEVIQSSALSTIAANTAVSAATSLIPFYHGGGIVHAAQGWTGVVPGAPNGGRDTVPAMLSPQEVVLNAGQADNVAAQLQQNSQSNGYQGAPYLHSELIYLGVNNHLKRTGQGELITSKNISKYIR